MKQPLQPERGAVAVYMALLMTLLVLSGALVQNAILSRQIRQSADVAQNERAFYASDSGIEAVLYELQKKVETSNLTPSTVTDSIPYTTGSGEFSATGKLVISEDQTRTTSCVVSTGTFGKETRRTAFGPTGCEVE